MIEAIFKYTFMQNALIGAFIASIICGVIGTIIVEKKMVMMSGGIAHASFGGIGLGYLIGIEPIIGGVIFALISSVVIVKINRSSNTNSDTLIAMFWAIGMALGILFISLMPGYPPDMTSYLFGDILTIASFDIRLISIIGVIVLLGIGLFFQHWKAYLFDEEHLKVKGARVDLYEYVMFALAALTIVALIKLVGIILSMALLTIPPAIAKVFTYDLKKIMIWAMIIGFISSFFGLMFSYQYDIQSGATIILFISALYITALGVAKTKNLR